MVASLTRSSNPEGAAGRDGAMDMDTDVEVGERQEDPTSGTGQFSWPRPWIEPQSEIQWAEIGHEIQDLHSALDHEKAQKEDLAERLASVMDTLEQVIEQKDELGERLHGVVDTLEQTIEQKDYIERQCSKLQEELTMMKTRLCDYESGVEQREQESESLSQTLEERGKESEQLRLQLHGAHEKISNLENALERKEKELETVRQTSKTEQEALSSQLREAEERVQTLDLANGERESALTQRINEAQEQCLALRMTSKERETGFTKRLKDAEEKCVILERASKDQEEEGAKLEELTSKLTALQESLEESQKSVEGKNLWISLLQGKHRDAETRLKETQEALTLHQEQSKTQQRELEERIQTLAKKPREMEHLHKTRESRLRAELDRQREEHIELQRQHAVVLDQSKAMSMEGQEELAAVLQENEELMGANKTLQNELTSKDIRVLELEVKIEDASTETESTIRMLCEQIDNLEVTLSNRAANETEAVRQYSDVAAQLSNLQAETEVQLAQRDALIREKGRQLEELREVVKPAEGVIFCVDCSGSMGGGGINNAKEDLRKLTTAIARRNPSANVAVLTHNSSSGVTTKHALSEAKPAMESCLTDVSPTGSEAWLSTLELAQDMLREYKRQTPKASCRVVCIGDGGAEWASGTDQGSRRHRLFTQLIEGGIPVHTVIHGRPGGNLPDVATGTNGINFDSTSSLTFDAPELIGTIR